MKKVNSIDVAKLAGVSQSTVSRVFSPNAKVTEEKRQRVLDAALKLGYKPNVLARSLKIRSTNLVGIVVADASSLFYANLISQLANRLRAIGKQPILFNVGLAETADEVLPTLLQYQVDALIIAATTLSDEMATECARNGTPVILFNRALSLEHVNSICIDNEDGGRKVAELLLAHQHQRFAYIAGITSTQTNKLRQKGYFDRIQEANISEPLYEQGDYSYQSGFDAAMRLLSQPSPPDAIFCANDPMAFGALDAAKALGLRIPDDLSVVGFDNVPQAAWQAYELTTVAQPMVKLLDATMSMLDKRLNAPSTPLPPITLFPGKLVTRKSVNLTS